MNPLRLLLLLIVPFIFPGIILAITPAEPAVKKLNVSAKIGEFSLNAKGIISPYASLSLSSDGHVYKSAVADASGRFSFHNILIKRGFSGFCITASDRGRLGQSEACFSFPPAMGDIEMSDIFLPPTLGLKNAEIAEGDDALLSGYTMPGAQVTIRIIGGESFITVADNDGRYEYRLSDVKRGYYELVTEATYLGKSSTFSSHRVGLRVLPLSNVVAGAFKNAANYLWEFAPLIGLFVLVFVICCIIWWDKILKLIHVRKTKLHHAWFVGY